MASIQATAHAATWQQQRCVCVMPHTTLCGCMNAPPPPPLPLISHNHPLGSFFFFCSHSHSSRLLALRVCVPCDLCSVGLSADTSISHKFISAATPTRCVPSPLHLLFLCSLAPLVTCPLAALSCRTLSPCHHCWWCGSALLKHGLLLVAGGWWLVAGGWWLVVGG